MTATETHATTDAQDIRIAYLADHLDALPTLVDWEVTTWGHLAPSRTPDDVRASFMRRSTRGAIPSTRLALDGATPVGMASLVQQDLTTRPELTPWLASVFVAPHARQRGIGGQLVRAVVADAKALGVPRLYLITPDRMAFYRRLGWTEQEVVEYRAESVTIMWIEQ